MFLNLIPSTDALRLITNQKSPICFDRTVNIVCRHHNLEAKTSKSGKIFANFNPLILLANQEPITVPVYKPYVTRYDFTDRTTFVLLARKPFVTQGEANYSCAVVYADGSMEESETLVLEFYAVGKLIEQDIFGSQISFIISVYC